MEDDLPTAANVQLAEYLVRERERFRRNGAYSHYDDYDDDPYTEPPRPKYKNLTLEKVVDQTAVTFDRIQEEFDKVRRELDRVRSQLDNAKAENGALNMKIVALEAGRLQDAAVVGDLMKRLAAIEERNKLLDTDWGQF